MARKLTRAQSAAWETIKAIYKPADGHWFYGEMFNRNPNGSIYASTGSGIRLVTLQGIEAAGLIVFCYEPADHWQAEFKLTDTGKAELTPAAAQPVAPELGSADNPPNAPADELEHLRRENAKLLASEDRYEVENAALRAALEEILNLPEPGDFQAAWSIAVATLREVNAEAQEAGLTKVE